jgi:putative phosphoribosyl transferase
MLHAAGVPLCDHPAMSDTRQFSDRTDAGDRLGAALRDRDVDVDVVLAIPRGGLPLGRAVADALDAPLDVVVASKIGAPGNPEYAIGAVASDGTVWRNDDAIRHTGADDAYFEREREKEVAVAREKAERYRGDRPELDLAGQRVALVDDGVATGSTARACLHLVEDADAEHVVLALPVGPPDTISELEGPADDVVCLQTPSAFRGVAQFYERFDQVSDEEAIAYLHDDDWRRLWTSDGE